MMKNENGKREMSTKNAAYAVRLMTVCSICEILWVDQIIVIILKCSAIAKSVPFELIIYHSIELLSD